MQTLYIQDNQIHNIIPRNTFSVFLRYRSPMEDWKPYGNLNNNLGEGIEHFRKCSEDDKVKRFVVCRNMFDQQLTVRDQDGGYFVVIGNPKQDCLIAVH